jgi:hypothetical protein
LRWYFERGGTLREKCTAGVAVEKADQLRLQARHAVKSEKRQARVLVVWLERKPTSSDAKHSLLIEKADLKR